MHQYIFVPLQVTQREFMKMILSSNKSFTEFYLALSCRHVCFFMSNTSDMVEKSLEVQIDPISLLSSATSRLWNCLCFPVKECARMVVLCQGSINCITLSPPTERQT